MDSTGQAQEKAQQVAGQAQEKAQEAAGQAKNRVREQLDQRSTTAGEQVSSTASDMRSVADQLREQGKEQPAKLAEQAADRADRLGGYLKDADADRILHDLESFGRRQPLAIMFGGLALGFAASRFLKASSAERASSGYPGSTQPRAQIPRTTTTPYSPPPAPSVGATTGTTGTTGTPVPPATSIPPAGDPGRFERPGVTTPGGGL